MRRKSCDSHTEGPIGVLRVPSVAVCFFGRQQPFEAAADDDTDDNRNVHPFEPKDHPIVGQGAHEEPNPRPRVVAAHCLARRRMNIELNFPPSFNELVLGCIDVDVCR